MLNHILGVKHVFNLFSQQQQMKAPNFKKSLEPVTVTEGQEAKFEIEFTGDPMPVVKWFRYSFPIDNSDDFKITTEDYRSTLTVVKACTDDTGIFSCVIENLGGASKSSTNLNVVESGQEYVLQASTRTMRKLQEMTVNAGDNIRFDIQFTAGDKSQLEFFHDGRPIKEEEEEGVKILFVNDLATLLIENATSKHSGLYECLMKTPGGEARCQVSCRVVEAAKIEAKMEAVSQSKMESSSLTQLGGSSQSKLETSQSKMEAVSSSMSQSKMESSSSSSKMMASSSSTTMSSSQERKSSTVTEQKIIQQK